MRVVWTSPALADVAATYRYIGRFNPYAARRVAEGLLVAGDSLATFPERGRAGRISGTRELVAERSYVIVYRVRHELVEIVRVWHSARDRSDPA